MMLKKLFLIICLSIVCILPAHGAFANVTILCYHEVDRAGDAFAVSHQRFENHLQFLKKEGYHFVSLDEYVRYCRGELNLPAKSVMITFDDGYRSFYTKVYPLLKKYQAPGMLAIVSSWTNHEEKPNDVRDTASWAELKEMEDSGLVAVVSHTHAMHKQLAINPQGGRNGVVGSHLYFDGRYETDEEYRTRVTNDINEVQRLFQENLGHKARAMVWPYGIYTKEAVDIAVQSGMDATFLLDGGVNEPGETSRLYAKRIIMESSFDVGRLKKLLTVNHDTWDSSGIRLAQVDLDNIYSKNQKQYEQNLEGLLINLSNNNINAVALQAFADPDGDGNVDEVYFANSQVPVRADIFNDVANRLQQQLITVLAWMPTLNYQSLISKDESNAVKSRGEKGWYHRLSPFDQNGLNHVNKLFYELAASTQIDGILLQDDLYLNQDEDFSLPAQKDYRQKFGKDLLAVNTNSKEDLAAFTQWKIEALDNAADGAIKAFKSVHPHAIVMRDVYAGTLLYADADNWLGQRYKDCLSKYDYTVVMAYPFMDKEEKPYEYLKKIAQVVKENQGTSKTLVKIQTYDWDKECWLDSKIFTRQMRTLKAAGMKNLGYYPLGFVHWEQ